jgi:hypothetical protein
MDLSIQPTAHMLGELKLETVAIAKRVVSDNDSTFGVVEGTPTELIETAILVTALGEIGAPKTDLRAGSLSIDQQIWLAALSVGRKGISNFKFGPCGRRFAFRGREVGRESGT